MTPSPRHACLPASALALLARRACTPGEEEGGYGALREAGRITGDRVFESLEAAPERMGRSEFWRETNDRMEALGLGRLEPGDLEPGLASVTWVGGAETSGPRGGSAGCPLAAGILEGLLSAAAGGPVGVLEVECAAAEADACRFLVGDPTRLRRLRRRLEGRAAPESAEAP